MKKWKGTVAITFYQEVTVEAATKQEAETLMCEAFELNQAECDRCEAFDVEEIKEMNHA